MHIQYVSLVIGKGADMLNKNPHDVMLSALDIVIDGVANSEATESNRAAGAYIAGLILMDAKGQLDSEKKKAILSIIEMVCETENTAFMSK
ncbi:hypothetical protein BA893_19110 [Vibrio natriegens]|uniref:hypothetical protein n=1 Tax=Vibrio natriegens TaxID=691 RepID=UPI0008045F8A|nr:hypothetical protein [Vibrio natriegens]ANQ23748.1 hypothetical protein BA893_19110 [Vibrio natriegens]